MTEPRKVCIVFADISGSTRLYEKLGDAEALRTVERCINRMERATQSQGGRVVKTIGDEVMAVFETVESGVEAAREMQRRIDELAPVGGFKLAIRIGLHCGMALVERNDVFGDTVNTASRIAGFAKAGQIVASVDCLAQLSPAVREATREIDDVAFKGKSDSLRVIEVLWQDAAELTMLSGSMAPVSTTEVLLRLCHGERVLILGAAQPLATLGRDAGSDVVIRDPRASRSHARIERRRDKYVLADVSSNGTYVSFGDEPEIVVKREEAILRGRGRLTFGHPWTPETAETVEFSVEG
jgi:class 3 adenylate cyclase